MTFANHEKTWQFNVNQQISGSASDHNKTKMLNIKNSLIGFASNPWTVVGSSNAVNAGLDSIDRWSTISNLTWGTVNRSWIVLKQSKIDTNFQMLISLDTSGSNTGRISVSAGGLFTGGSISANPTATDEQVLCTAGWGGYASLTFPFDGSALHVMQTDDGYCTRILSTKNINGFGRMGMYWNFEKAKNPVSGWTNPYFSSAAGIAISDATAYISYTTDSGYFLNFTNQSGPFNANEFNAWHNGIDFDLYFTAEGASNEFLLYSNDCINEISNKYQVYPCGLFCPTSNARGRHGEVYDFYFGSQNNHLSYYDDLNGQSRKWIQLGNVILPWNGTLMSLG